MKSSQSLRRVLIGGIVLGIASIATMWALRANWNTLAVGRRARIEPQYIALAPPIEMDGMTKAQVYDLREEAVGHYPDLMAGQYEPSFAIFGQIVDGKPWWGMAGQHYYLGGEHSIDGLAEESRFILNPYLLVAADFQGLTDWAGTGFAWDTSTFDAADLVDPDFPISCEAESVHWWPDEARGEVIYSVTRCLRDMGQYTERPLTYRDAWFDLLAYNARDMNLNWMYVAYDQSSNVRHDSPPITPFRISHYIHLGNSCMYPGGCNNMSPATPEISNLSISGLPARAIIRLWRSRPASVEASPDFVWVIYME